MVQFRDPVEAIISYYKLDIAMKGIPDSKQEWERFAINAFEYWKKFKHKWVKSPIKQRYICHYANLIEDPFKELHEVAKFVSGKDGEDGDKIDVNKVREILKEIEVKRLNNVESFQHYDQTFIDRIFSHENDQ